MIMTTGDLSLPSPDSDAPIFIQTCGPENKTIPD
jgi:hypothetical protein